VIERVVDGLLRTEKQVAGHEVRHDEGAASRVAFKSLGMPAAEVLDHRGE
jgi:hypothetical protein